MKAIKLIIENDEFAALLQRMLEQMQFVKVFSEDSGQSTMQSAKTVELENEPVWNAESIRKDYFFDKNAVVGQLDCKESAEELIQLLSI